MGFNTHDWLLQRLLVPKPKSPRLPHDSLLCAALQANNKRERDSDKVQDVSPACLPVCTCLPVHGSYLRAAQPAERSHRCCCYC